MWREMETSTKKGSAWLPCRALSAHKGRLLDPKRRVQRATRSRAGEECWRCSAACRLLGASGRLRDGCARAVAGRPVAGDRANGPDGRADAAEICQTGQQTNPKKKKKKKKENGAMEGGEGVLVVRGAWSTKDNKDSKSEDED